MMQFIRGRVSTVVRGLLLAGIITICASESPAGTENLGDGFAHHGVATPVSTSRGIVATVDGNGRNVVLVWLYDHRGGYALLMIDAQTGESQEYPMPFPPGGDGPFASILSSGNKFYTHFNSHFCEFDPVKRAFTFHHKTAPQMAMGMTEDDNGVIWSVTYPQSGVVSFDPKTRKFRDYGHVHKENWAQYQRDVAADDAGWIYFGIGSTRSHVIGLDPESGKARPMVPESERVHGKGQVFRAVNGKVYGTAAGQDGWYEFYKGEAKRVGKRPQIKAKPIITSSQGLFHRRFPDGKEIVSCNLIDRVLKVKDPRTGKTTSLKFDYQSEGAHVMSVAAAPDGTLCGGTAFPMRFFSFDPRSDKWTNRDCYGQWNTVARQGDRFFVGGYASGFLLEWDPSRAWVPTKIDDPGSNPRHLAECHPAIGRPHALLAHPDGNLVVMGGTPGYGLTGGGLLLWDRKAGRGSVLTHTEIVPDHSTFSLLALPQGKLLGGTTVGAGTGGEVKAKVAEFYILDIASRKVEWHEPVLPGARTICDLFPGPDGLIYGMADYARFFVFDPATRKIVHDQDAAGQHGRASSGQGPRIFVRDPKGTVYMLFAAGIARVDPAGYRITMLAKSPVPIHCGGDYYEGRIYFASGSHVYSYDTAREGKQAGD